MPRHVRLLSCLALLPACFDPASGRASDATGVVDDTGSGSLSTSTTVGTDTGTSDSASTTGVDGTTTEAPGDTTDDTDPTTGTVDGSTTSPVDPCDPDPCVGGTCSADSGAAVCTCDQGWVGDLCDACDRGYVMRGTECVPDAASCDDAPCGDGATCAIEDDAIVCTQVFGLTGDEQQWVVPATVTSVDATARGASGGCALGGLGGEAVATVPVAPGDVLSVYVGGAGACSMAATLPGGFNGGGNKFTDAGDSWEGGSGGGATDFRRNGVTLGHRVLVAGGGGGQGWGGQAGHGGGEIGETCNGIGGGCVDETCGGRGGTQVDGGIGGFCYGECEGEPGALGQGGNSDGCAAAGGGGGGGYYGGGGGAHCSGGGGSSRVDFPGNVATSTTIGVQAGDGELTLVWRP